MCFASLMARCPGRAGFALWPGGEERPRLAGPADLPLPAAAGHHLPRRLADHGRGLRLVAQHAEGEGAPLHLAASAVLQASRRRGARSGQGRPRADTRAQPAAPHRDPADLLEGAGGRAATSRLPRSSGRSARAPTGSGASTSASSSSSSASRTGGGTACRRASGSTISTSCASIISATAMSPSRPSRPASSCSGRSSLRASGRRATTSRRSRTGG